MYKAVVFFDLDQTLLNDDKQVPPENVAALKALEANQILPVIATGRNYYELADIMAATGASRNSPVFSIRVQHKTFKLPCTTVKHRR